MFGHYPEGSFWPGFATRTRADMHVAAMEACEATIIRYCQMADLERNKISESQQSANP